ncbi:MAG: hypothetical protein ACJ75B_20735 [Flavisolibacter sp.]
MKRNDSIQTETNNITGDVLQARIKWIDDCEYELTDFKEAKDSSDTLKPVWKGKVFSTKILEVHSNYCVYESRMSGVSVRMIDTLKILN